MREETSTEKMDFVEMGGFVININTGRIFFSYKTAEAYKKKKSFLLFSKLQRVFLDTHREEGLFPDVTIEQ